MPDIDEKGVVSAPIPISLTGGSLTDLGKVIGSLNNRVKVKRLPFSKSTSEYDTGWDLPDNAVVLDVFIKVVTNASSSTIDVGLDSSESGGDADGFLDGVSCASAGFVQATQTSTSSGGQTLGALLSGTEIKSADTTAIYFKPKKFHFASSVAAKSVTYTTSNHTIAGYIYILFFDASETDYIS